MLRASRPRGLESLEDRRLLSATPLSVPSGEIGLYRHGVLVQTFDPATDTDVDRGTALRAALAATQDFDEVILGAFTFDMGATQHVEFPDRVTVTGAGKELTRITSSCPQSTDGAATFTLNNETNIQDLWLEGSLQNGLYQPLVGMQGGPTENVTAYLRRLKITGDSDGIFVWTGSQYTYTIYGYDCDVTTHYDAVAVLGSGANPQTVKLYNCSLTVGQPDPIPAHISNAVNVRSGMVGLYNCTIHAAGDIHSLQTTGVWSWNKGSAEIVNTTFDVSAPAGIADDLLIQNGTQVKVVGGQGSGPGGQYVSSSHTEVYVPWTPSVVLSENLFYNNSAYDNRLPRVGGHDDGAAIATDKTPLLPGNRATFANVSSYTRGINGIAVDLSGYHGDMTADDFEFKIGNNNAPSTWAEAPDPVSVAIFGRAGANASDRVELTWNDRAIVGKWLQVTMAANQDTGLSDPVTFLFGNALADSGLGDTATLAVVDTTDQLGPRNNPASIFNHIPLTNRYDYNRDAVADTLDELSARNNATTIGTALRFLDLTSALASTSAASVAATFSSAQSAANDEADSLEPIALAAPPMTPLPQPRAVTSDLDLRDAAIREATLSFGSEQSQDDDLLAALLAELDRPDRPR